MDAGLIGGIAGGVLGVAGGAFGTWMSIRNTNGPRERAFMSKASIVAWIAVLLFVAALLLTPAPYKWLWWIPYSIGLPWGIISLNRTQRRLRLEEAQSPK